LNNRGQPLEEATAVAPMFYEGVAEEQKFLYGFHVIECYNSKLFSEDLQNSLQISLEANAVPYITNTINTGSETKLIMSSPPSETVSYFVTSQTGLANVMLASFPGDQIYKK